MAKKPPGKSKKKGAPKKTPGVRRLAGPFNHLVMLVLIAFWILPIIYVGGMKRDVRSLPKWLRHQHRIACLFTNEVTSWKTYHIEVQTDVDPTWHELPEDPYFEMTVFGYRSKMHRVLGHSYMKSRGEMRILALARYIQDRHRELFPDGPRIDRLRFVRAWYPVRELAEQTGRFVKPPLEDISPRRQSSFGEVVWNSASPDGRLVDPGEFKRKRRKMNQRRRKRSTAGAKQRPAKRPERALPSRPLKTTPPAGSAP